ncbi:transglutaminase family protein [Desertibaculum subflavum]|uniref:transglutaminase family protein n=1 Tax=Desertibaculum subflavum TaxID=2268458 RepID=UPI0034D2EFBA
MRYALRHLTRYAYGAPVDLGYHVLRMSPRETARQKVLSATLALAPQPSRDSGFIDHFGNAARHVVVEMPHSAFSATLEAVIEVARRGAGALPAGPSWEAVRDAMRDDGFPADPAVAEFCYASPLAPADEAAGAYAAACFPAGRPIVQALRDLTARIRRDFAYLPGATDITTPVAEVMAAKRGVCQDFTHVMIAGLRRLGLPARYVSGYLRTYPTADAHALRGADASHAWIGAWCGPEIGWLDFDPTNDLVVDQEHITLAWGRDFDDVSPLRGVILGGGTHGVEVAVTVTPLD